VDNNIFQEQFLLKLDKIIDYLDRAMNLGEATSPNKILETTVTTEDGIEMNIRDFELAVSKSELKNREIKAKETKRELDNILEVRKQLKAKDEELKTGETE